MTLHSDARTCKEWLQILDELEVVDEAWRDSKFVELVSWIMLMTMWRRMNTRLIDAGYAYDPRFTC